MKTFVIWAKCVKNLKKSEIENKNECILSSAAAHKLIFAQFIKNIYVKIKCYKIV